MTLIKTLIAANKSERDAFHIPRSVQQSIPIRRIYSDGIWQGRWDAGTAGRGVLST